MRRRLWRLSSAPAPRHLLATAGARAKTCPSPLPALVNSATLPVRSKRDEEVSISRLEPLLLVAHVFLLHDTLRQSMTNISSVLKRSDNNLGPAGVTRIMS